MVMLNQHSVTVIFKQHSVIQCSTNTQVVVMPYQDKGGSGQYDKVCNEDKG